MIFGTYIVYERGDDHACDDIDLNFVAVKAV